MSPARRALAEIDSGRELERRVHQPELGLVLREQALADHPRAAVQALHRAAALPHDADLAGPVVQERLERFGPLDRTNRDAADHPGELDLRAWGGRSDRDGARDLRGPRRDLRSVA